MKKLLQSLLTVMATLGSATGTEEPIYARVGDTVTLTPPRGGDLQKNYVTWYFGNHEIAGYNTFSTWVIKETKWQSTSMLVELSLQIKSISLEHFGTFTCRITTGVDQAVVASVSYKLIKVDVSKIPTSPLLPGDSFSLACDTEAPQGHNKPKIHWLDTQGNVNQATMLTMTATSQHTGEWTCVVATGKTTTEYKVLVTVVDLSPPLSRSQYTSKSSSLSIPCSISSQVSWEQVKAVGIQGGHWDFFPKPDSGLVSPDPQRLFSLSLEDPVHWEAEKDTGLIPTSDVKKGDLSLTRTEGREEDRGRYVCSLKFRSGVTLNRTVDVHVLQISSSRGTDLISGQTLNLNCSLGFPLPSNLQLKWIPPAQSSVHPMSTDSSLHITVDVGDSGKWRCELWEGNSKKTSAEIKLKIERRYSVWMLVIICSAIVIGFLLLLLVFILWRRRQQKTRHPRHRLCKCKNPKPKGFYRT